MDKSNVGKGTEPRSVSFWDSTGMLAHMLENAANDRGISSSKLLQKIVLDNIDDYMEPDDTRQEWLEVQKKQWNEKFHKDIARDRKRDNTFVWFISKQLFDQYAKGASDDEIQNWIDAQEEIFDMRGHEEKFEDVKKNPQDYASRYYRYLQRSNDELPAKAHTFENMVRNNE